MEPCAQGERSRPEHYTQAQRGISQESSPMTRVKVLVLPVYRRAWLYHAWLEGVSDKAPHAGPWWQAPTLPEKCSALSHHFNTKANQFVAEQWAANAAAKEGSFRHWLHRLALYVMSKEDPTETFLKRLPRHDSRQPMTVEVLYPPSLDATLVRRRLRHAALRNTTTHKRALLGWGLACVPQLPLVISPFPNVTLYYSVYRLVSHYQAWGGADTLKSAFENPDSATLQRQVDSLVHEGTGQGDTSKGRLTLRCRHGTGGTGHRRLGGHLAPDQRLEALLQRAGVHGRRTPAPHTPTDKGNTTADASQEQHHQQQAVPLLVMVSSPALEDIVQPLERWHTPLDSSALSSLSKASFHPDLSGLEEHLDRVRKHAVESERQRDMRRGRAGGGADSQRHDTQSSRSGDGPVTVQVSKQHRSGGDADGLELELLHQVGRVRHSALASTSTSGTLGWWTGWPGGPTGSTVPGSKRLLSSDAWGSDTAREHTPATAPANVLGWRLGATWV